MTDNNWGQVEDISEFRPHLPRGSGQELSIDSSWPSLRTALGEPWVCIRLRLRFRLAPCANERLGCFSQTRHLPSILFMRIMLPFDKQWQLPAILTQRIQEDV